METDVQAVLEALEGIIHTRRNADDSKSYTAQLLHDPLDRVLKKVGEEATELVLAAKGGERGEIIHESADLLYHMLVLLVRRDIAVEDVALELSRRFGISGLTEKANRGNH